MVQKSLQIVRPPKSGVVLMGRRFSFNCKAKGDPPVKIKWFKNGVEMNKHGRNNFYRISPKSGHLRFTQVNVIDRGTYKCRAENGLEAVESKEVTLAVHAPAKIVELTKDKAVEFGTTIVIRCTVAGIPTPTLEWKKDDQVVQKKIPSHSENTNYVNITTPPIVEDEYTINVTEAAKYNCEAHNHPHGGYTKDSRTTHLYLLSDHTNPYGTYNLPIASGFHLFSPSW
ncbi:hypothetical protein LOTGIDRAFT_165669 [Lottia gigantea]|uniref:Ig-like domain-containing protein n=1 Tax=Lottia gigantea TaxID=225164 RepID=V4BHK1_LOTGI|nr:hypothetical protein LOTGIDRAFT_165669 [Lottia gigantea]ESO88239.1 hypothetical protein LOTGIDRAFT_165669 [Lottia gigantea]